MPPIPRNADDECYDDEFVDERYPGHVIPHVHCHCYPHHCQGHHKLYITKYTTKYCELQTQKISNNSCKKETHITKTSKNSPR